jgi:hypothetical protein
MPRKRKKRRTACKSKGDKMIIFGKYLWGAHQKSLIAALNRAARKRDKTIVLWGWEL